ncbi:hypothetical protein SPHINGO8BC_110185 [Sphingobacterium multivorum]|uniref:Uncharacterized protein n=1 Tax=Sphingobacterium multivorum TaxID=28454 RepID=A0A653YHV0_SPHMU|nr:hypothetical protein SPHINGO8BC_110185 [Sphingobacterium multivorum]
MKFIKVKTVENSLLEMKLDLICDQLLHSNKYISTGTNQ